MKLPVLHVGFHKCGSTTLQNALFARHPDIANLGEPIENPSALAALSNAWESCCDDPARRKPYDLDRGRRLWQQALAGVECGKVAVFSKERLTRYGYCGAPECLPPKLRALVGPARVVIMTRHQIRLIESLFHSKTNGVFSLERWLEKETQGPLNKERFHVYRFHAFAEAYAKAFGRENVGVFLLEDLAANAESFARRLCDFIGIDADEGTRLLQGKRFNSRTRFHGTTRRGLVYSRARKLLGQRVHVSQYVPTYLVETFSSFLRRGRPMDVQLPARWVAELESYYRADNCRLAEDWNLPLKKFGYPL